MSTTGAVVLHFADGSTRQIRGRGDFLLGLFPGAFGGKDLSPAQAAQLELIRQSVDSGAGRRAYDRITESSVGMSLPKNQGIVEE